MKTSFYCGDTRTRGNSCHYYIRWQDLMPRSDAQDKSILLSPAGESVGSGVRAANETDRLRSRGSGAKRAGRRVTLSQSPLRPRYEVILRTSGPVSHPWAPV